MSNEQQPIRVPAPGRVVSGPAKGVVGRVFAVEGDSVSIQLGSGVIIVHRRDVEQDDSEPIEDSVPPAQPTPMTAEQMVEILQALDAATPGEWIDNGNEIVSEHNLRQGIAGAMTEEDNRAIVAAVNGARSLLAEVQRWKDQARKEYEFSCKLQDEARERETALTDEVQRQQGEIGIHLAEIDRMTRKWAQEVVETKRLQAENDQLRSDKTQCQEYYAARLNERDSENHRLRQQLGEAVEKLDTVGVSKSLRYPIKHDICGSDAEYDQITAAQRYIAKLKGDRTDG